MALDLYLSTLERQKFAEYPANSGTPAIRVIGADGTPILGTTLIAGEDTTNNVLKVEQRYSYATISTAATTVIKSGAGFVHNINIAGGTLGAITVYDNTAGSGTTIVPTFTPTAAVPNPALELDVAFGTGLTIVTAAATILVISYR